jgi:hypothetical protein
MAILFGKIEKEERVRQESVNYLGGLLAVVLAGGLVAVAPPPEGMGCPGRAHKLCQTVLSGFLDLDLFLADEMCFKAAEAQQILVPDVHCGTPLTGVVGLSG